MLVFSPTHHSEKHFQSLLQLFLPHYSEEELKPPQFITFQEFYSQGLSVPTMMKCNLKFEYESENLYKCQEAVEKFGHPEDDWAALCP